MLSEHTKLRVMLVDDDHERLALLEKALETEGHHVVAKLNTHADLSMAVALHKPEVVFIDVGAPGRDILQSLGEMYREHPRPIVLWAEQSDAQTTRRALDAGVSAYVVDDLQHRKNFSALLDLAIARFEMQQALRQELDRAKTRLADLRDIEKAKGLLMKRRGLDEAAAYNLLRRMAMDRKQKIGDFSRTLLSAADVWSELGG